MNDVVLAVDLGGTNMRMAAVAPEGNILGVAREVTPSDVSPSQLIDLTARLADECGKFIPAGAVVRAIAFAAPAPAAKDCSGILTKLPNLPSLNGMDLGTALHERFSLPVTLENDATAAAIGEHWIGASRESENSIMLTLGTGVGGGLIINGEPFRGIDGTAGEIGHFCVEPDGHPCGCGSRGCIEQYASATAVVRMGREADLSFGTAHEIYEAAIDGNRTAASVFAQMGRYLGITLAGLANTLNPEMIVIGGGLAAGWDAFIDPLHAELLARAFEVPAKRAKIVPAVLGDNAGLIGVARTAFLRA